MSAGSPSGMGPASAQVPGPVAVEQVEFQAGADVDRVKLVGVLVPELPGDERPDIAAGGDVPLVAERLGHQGVPEVGDLPEVHVRVVRVPATIKVTAIETHSIGCRQ